MTRIYREQLCKIHFLDVLAKELRLKIHKLYKDPETAFATFNFRGQPTIRMQDILNHAIMRGLDFSSEDVKSYLLRENVFPTEDSEIDFTRFKKYFFPKLMLIQDDAEIELQKKEDFTLESFIKIAKQQGKLKFDSARVRGGGSEEKIKKLQQQRLAKDRESYVIDRLSKLTVFLRDKF